MRDIEEKGKTGLEGCRILVIEDNAQNMRLFRAVLQLADATVSSASRADEGITLAKNEMPDVILMDVQMPGMDGLTATRLLRADDATRDIPVIAVTASVLEEDRHRIEDAGCDGYIPKPIDPDYFAAQVAAMLEQRQTVKEGRA